MPLFKQSMPEGGELEYMDAFMLSRALDQRVVWEQSSTLRDL